jgi:hypothetical protein
MMVWLWMALYANGSVISNDTGCLINVELNAQEESQDNYHHAALLAPTGSGRFS